MTPVPSVDQARSGFGDGSVIDFFRLNPTAGLLLAQLIGIVLYPWMESSPRGHALLTGFGVLVLGLALRVVQRSPWLTWLAALLAVAVVVLNIFSTITPHRALTAATAGMEAAFYLYATGSLITYIVRDHVATTDEFFAAGATFTLLAWAFAYLYVMCQALMPGSFVAANDPQVTRTWIELLFLSVAVLSSVGLSDILPATPVARSLVMLESFAGVLYIALVVSYLISLNAAARRVRPPGS